MNKYWQPTCFSPSYRILLGGEILHYDGVTVAAMTTRPKKKRLDNSAILVPIVPELTRIPFHNWCLYVEIIHWENQHDLTQHYIITKIKIHITILINHSASWTKMAELSSVLYSKVSRWKWRSGSGLPGYKGMKWGVKSLIVVGDYLMWPSLCHTLTWCGLHD